MPFPKNGLGDLYSEPDEYFLGSDVEFLKKNSLEMMKSFERKIGEKGRFLDVGCGVGYTIWAAQELGWEFEGVDPSKSFIETGRERLGVQGKPVALQQANFPSDYFDAIQMSSILEHLYNPVEVLHEVRRVLKPGGWLYFDAPNEDGLYMKFGNAYMRLQGRDWLVVMAPTFPPYHVQGFNPKSLRILTDRAQFQIRELKMCGAPWAFTGQQTLRVKLEFRAAQLVNRIDKLFGGGIFMTAWCQKK